VSAGEDDLEALLGLSVELVQIMKEADMEAAMDRHPSGKEMAPPAPVDVVDTVREGLTARDRCDDACSAAALYRIRLDAMTLEFCHHHHNKHFPRLEPSGWQIVGENTGLYEELYGRNRLQGGDHA
jgi:hypothetical protein